MPTPSRRPPPPVAVVVGLWSACCRTCNPACYSTQRDSPATVGPMRPVTAQPVAADGALECPATITDQEGMTVPQQPQGVDGNARLLPDRQPESLVVCAYPVLVMVRRLAHGALPAQDPHGAVRRRAVRDGRAAHLGAAGQPAVQGRARPWAGTRPRTSSGRATRTPIVWVAAKADPNGCSQSTNGDFVSSDAVGSRLGAAFGDKSRPDPAPTGACASWPRSARRPPVDRPRGDPRSPSAAIAPTGPRSRPSCPPSQSVRSSPRCAV